MAKLGDEAEVKNIKFTDEMRESLQDRVTNTMESRPTLPPA